MILLILLLLLTSASAQHCHRNGTNGCETCRHYLYLHNGTCVDECPNGYVERRPSWVFSWKREIGRTCEKSGTFAVQAWGSSDHGGNASSVSQYLTSGVQTIFSTTFAFAALKTVHSKILQVLVCMGLS